MSGKITLLDAAGKAVTKTGTKSSLTAPATRGSFD